VIELVATSRAHILQLKLDGWRELEREMVVQTIDPLPDGGENFLFEHARTLFKGEEKLAVFGVWPILPGVARAWALISDTGLKHPKALHQHASRSLESFLRGRPYVHRIEAVVLAGHIEGSRWAQHLGFEYEGVMHNYAASGTQDCILYSRLQ